MAKQLRRNYKFHKKCCNRCGVELTELNWYKVVKGTHDYRCKKCYLEDQRNYYHSHTEERNKYKRKGIHKKLGLTENYYDSEFKKQNGVCAICGNLNLRGKRKFLDIDHNHLTGKVRGLLCNDCNTAIGKLQVDKFGIEFLVSAISYLRNTDNGT